MEQAGNFTVGSNTATANGSSMATVYGLASPNVSVQSNFTLSASRQFGGVVARYQGPLANNYYLAQLYEFAPGQFQAYISRSAGGSFTQLATSSVFTNPGNPPFALNFQVEGASLKLYVNGVLMAFASDATYATGGVGIYSGSGVVFNSFNAADITPAPAPSLTFNEGFSSTPNNQLSTNWVEQTGDFTVASNTATANGTSMATVYGVSSPNVSVQSNFTLTASGQFAGVIARYQGPLANNYYLGQIYESAPGQFQAYISRSAGGSYSHLAISPTFAGPVNSTFAVNLQVEGSSLKLYVNGVLKAFASDATAALATGGVGIFGGSGAVFNSFSAADITPAPAPSLTFNEDFSAPSNGNQLSPNWVEQAGNYTDTGATAVSNGTSMATVYGVTSPNVSVQSNFTITASGQFAGLIARYQGPLVNNYYLGQIYESSPGQFQAYISRSAGGSYSHLAISPFFAGPVNSTFAVNFQVEGTSLKLFVNGALKVYANDATFATGGIGMYSGSGAVYNSFNAADITPAPVPALPFNDNFSSPSNVNQLSNSWVEKAGNFTVASNIATGAAAVNVATAYALSTSVVNLQGTLAFSAVGQVAGLIANYSGPGDANYYYAEVKSLAGGKFQATIFKNVNGVLTSLTTLTNIATFAGSLRFTVSGGSLTLNMDAGSAILTFTDNSPLVAGGIGMRTTAGGSVAGFTAN